MDVWKAQYRLIGTGLLSLAGVVACTGSEAGQEAGARAFFDSGGASISYVDQGSGEPVILVHGGFADAEWNWIDPGVAEALAEEFRVVSLDLRGHGQSSKLYDPRDYGEEMVLDILRLMDHLGFATAHIVGYSMGGDITMALLTSHPDRVERAFVGGGGGLQQGDWGYEEYGFFADQLDGLEPGVSIAEAAFGVADLGESTNMVNDNDAQALSAAFAGMQDLVIPESAYRSNEVPVLLWSGSEDRYLPLSEAAYRVGSNMELRVVDGLGHTDVVSAPELVSDIMHFLNDDPLDER